MKSSLKKDVNNLYNSTMEKVSKDYDMVILGHRKMGELKESISDSEDQDIANEVLCPVLIINKDLRPKD